MQHQNFCQTNVKSKCKSVLKVNANQRKKNECKSTPKLVSRSRSDKGYKKAKIINTHCQVQTTGQTNPKSRMQNFNAKAMPKPRPIQSHDILRSNAKNKKKQLQTDFKNNSCQKHTSELTNKRAGKCTNGYTA